MAHVIDSLVVELGLDASKFNAQQRTAVQQSKNFVNDLRRSSVDAEVSANRTAESFTAVGRKAVAMFGAFLGVRGIADFIQKTIYAGAAVGRLSRAIGVNAGEISRWQGVAREFGSTGEAMAASFKQLSNVFTAWQVGGPEAPGVMQIFRAINTEAQKLDRTNAAQIDSTKSLTQNYMALAQNLKIIHDLAGDPNLASYLAGHIPGMDAGMFDMLIQGSDKLAENLKKIRGFEDDTAEASGRLQRRWDALKVSAENLGLRLLFGAIDAAPGFVSGLTGGKIAPGQGTFTRPSINATDVSGGFTSQRQKEAFIRAEAAKRGIDPDTAMAVARSEGFNGFVSAIPGETSYGAFQLHTTPGGRGRAVGDLFREKTGLDPADPRNEAAGIQFALDWAKTHGWHDFHGAANGAHLSNWAGIGQRGGGTTTVQHMEINGPVTIQTQSGSPEQIRNGLREAGLRRQAQANQSYVGGE